MKQTFNFLLMLVMVASVLSCKKSDPELTPAQKIVGKYNLTASTGTTAGVTKDYLATRPACQADDIREFTADGKFIISEGATSCPTPSSTVTASYTLSTDGKTLIITGISSSGVTQTETYTVEELTSSILRITTNSSQTDPSGNPIIVKINGTLTKI